MIINTPSGDKQIKSLVASPSVARYGTWSSETWTGKNVTVASAQAISTWYAGTNLIAKTGGTLPLVTYDRSSGVPKEVDATKSQVALRLRYQPNPYMSANQLFTTLLLHLLNQGNGYLAKVWERGDYAPSLYLIPPDNVLVSRGENGQKIFHVIDAESGRQFTLTTQSVLHIPGLSLGDGLMGYSPIAIQRQRLGVSLASSEHQARFFAQGGSIKGVISVDGTLTTEAARTIQDQWQATYGGVDNAWKTAVLDHGAKYSPISMSHEDAQFIEMMKYSATEIAVMLNIPPAMLGAEGQSLTYANAQQNDLHFLKFTLRPWLRYVEAAINNDPDIFGATSAWYPAFDVDDLVRPDITTRFAAWNTGIQSGFLTVNEVRDEENLPPVQVESGQNGSS